MTKAAAMEIVSPCSCCGVIQGGPRTYHPYAACLIFKQTRSSEAMQMNLAAVVDDGMKAAKAGITLEQALADSTSVLFREQKGA